MIPNEYVIRRWRGRNALVQDLEPEPEVVETLKYCAYCRETQYLTNEWKTIGGRDYCIRGVRSMESHKHLDRFELGGVLVLVLIVIVAMLSLAWIGGQRLVAWAGWWALWAPLLTVVGITGVYALGFAASRTSYGVRFKRALRGSARTSWY